MSSSSSMSAEKDTVATNLSSRSPLPRTTKPKAQDLGPNLATWGTSGTLQAGMPTLTTGSSLPPLRCHCDLAHGKSQPSERYPSLPSFGNLKIIIINDLFMWRACREPTYLPTNNYSPPRPLPLPGLSSSGDYNDQFAECRLANMVPVVPLLCHELCGDELEKIGVGEMLVVVNLRQTAPRASASNRSTRMLMLKIRPEIACKLPQNCLAKVGNALHAAG